MTPSLFDPAVAERLKERGISTAVCGREDILELARKTARMISRRSGQVTADDVRREFEASGFDWSDLGNAAGSIFRGKGWVCEGYRKSKVASRHAGIQRVWRWGQ